LLLKQTSCTVGYGDFAPTTQAGRLLFVFFVPIGVCLVTDLLSRIANYIIDRKLRSFHEQLKMKELTEYDLEVMDADGDGNVTRAEFLEFMLVAMNKVDQNLLNDLQELFHRLDEDNSGTLSKQDLKALASRKKTKHKLEMAEYKRQLLEKADRAEQARMRNGRWFSEKGNTGTSVADLINNEVGVDDLDF